MGIQPVAGIVAKIGVFLSGSINDKSAHSSSAVGSAARAKFKVRPCAAEVTRAPKRKGQVAEGGEGGTAVDKFRAYKLLDGFEQSL